MSAIEEGESSESGSLQALRLLKVCRQMIGLNWFMHPVARVSINKYRSVISKRVTIVYTVTAFEISYYKPREDGHQ
jgi:hypothetical protein